MTTRVLVLKPTVIKVAPRTRVDLDAHHEYYLDDDEQARKLIEEGRAVELDARGRRVETATRTAAEKPKAETKPDGPAGKPGSSRRTKATAAPETKTAAKSATSRSAARSGGSSAASPAKAGTTGTTKAAEDSEADDAKGGKTDG
ncbi:hypothetical protein [Streptomyces sp. DH37]|uniref:hypothetical protein n=1 Tax=Streptomyces sp. DH37 TaxID=3040122 RepID=UPI002441D138|nr:hypothetical protein [Streptomyces sp. DH37]MDG9703808.1 hypothetical protein [Streptomyces sp. DH37]